jgi:hypothetical protein
MSINTRIDIDLVNRNALIRIHDDSKKNTQTSVDMNDLSAADTIEGVDDEIHSAKVELLMNSIHLGGIQESSFHGVNLYINTSASPVSSGKPPFLSQSTPSPASTSVNTAALIVPQRRKSSLLHVFPDLNVLGGLSNSSPSQHMQRLNSAAISAGLQNLPTFSRRNSMLNNNNDAASTLQHYRGLTADDQHGGGLIIPPHSRKSSILGNNLSIASRNRP